MKACILDMAAVQENSDKSPVQLIMIKKVNGAVYTHTDAPTRNYHMHVNMLAQTSNCTRVHRSITCMCTHTPTHTITEASPLFCSATLYHCFPY